MLLTAVCLLVGVVGFLLSFQRFGFPLYARFILLFGSQFILTCSGWVLLSTGTTAETVLVGQLALWSTFGALVLLIFDYLLCRPPAPATINSALLILFSYILGIFLVIVSAVAVPAVVMSPLAASPPAPHLAENTTSSLSLPSQSPPSSPSSPYRGYLAGVYHLPVFFPASAWIEYLILGICSVLALVDFVHIALGRGHRL